ncbi:MAG: MBL fold metallo-hydrolase [Flavobacteriales bacterium]|nr:MBL fold metallo-hydrolase [Flavobacteriales bacterium]MDW8409901.1 MBL fold metallo-hydrolase [Flavobacteriales bacterium]
MTTLTFRGAARTVTGSRHLLELPDGRRILMDCGLFQGSSEYLHLNSHFGFAPHSINALLLTHAHIDHCGLIPRLCREGFAGPIFCTPATRELTRLMLYDAAHIQEEDIRHINKLRLKQGVGAAEPLYTSGDVTRCLKQFQTVPFGEKFEPLPGVECLFTVAGHILGSAVINLIFQDSKGQPIRLCYTGDLGRYNDPIMLAPGQPMPADYVICESTYGDRLHDEDADTASELLSEIEYTCLTKKGVLVIPAFSVGRTQGLLYHLNSLYNKGKLPSVDIFVDSPLAREATQVVRRFPELYNERLRKELEKDADLFGFPGLFFVETHEESQKLNERKHPFVVIAGSGMADAGRVKHHIMHRIDDRKNTILITGYAEPETLAGRLKSGAKEVRIFGNEFPVRCEVHTLRSMSAHGDAHDLLRFLTAFEPKKLRRLFLVHGNYESQLYFADLCRAKGYTSVDIPSLGAVRSLE